MSALVRSIAGIPCEVISPSLYRIVLPDPPIALATGRTIGDKEIRTMVAGWLGIDVGDLLETTVSFVFTGGAWRIAGLRPWAEGVTFPTVVAAAEQLVRWIDHGLDLEKRGQL